MSDRINDYTGNEIVYNVETGELLVQKGGTNKKEGSFPNFIRIDNLIDEQFLYTQ